jgi:4'-phosphopantetheinyl transferase EntD
VIERLLPDGVVAVETREDLLDVELFPEEKAAIGNAVEKRRREFVTVRACARTALQRLELPPQPILNGERGEPLWPADIVGSITHCNGYRACALAHANVVVTVGIDAEPHASLPDGVLAEIALAEERSSLDALRRAMPAVHWDRLLFSAKESVYKAWFPLAKRWLGFEDATVRIDVSQERDGAEKAASNEGECVGGNFFASLLVEGPWLAGRQLTSFSGRWLACDGLVLTAIALIAAAPSTADRLSSQVSDDTNAA